MVMSPGDGPGSPVATAHPDHQPRVPHIGRPWCTCGFMGGSGRPGDPTPLLADHLREHDPSYGKPRSR